MKEERTVDPAFFEQLVVEKMKDGWKLKEKSSENALLIRSKGLGSGIIHFLIFMIMLIFVKNYIAPALIFSGNLLYALLNFFILKDEVKIKAI